LTRRTGPYRIVVTKEGAPVARQAPQLRATIVNPAPRPLVLGDSPSSRVVLNAVVQNDRSIITCAKPFFLKFKISELGRNRLKQTKERVAVSVGRKGY
jgi:hypothetical protein